MNLARQTSIYLVASLLRNSAPLLLLPLLTRTLSREEYGFIALFVATATFLAPIVGLGQPSFLRVTYFKESREQFSRHLEGTFLLLLASTGVLLVLSAVAAPAFEALVGLPPLWLFAALLTTALNYVVRIQLTLHQIRGEALGFGALQVGHALLDIALVTLFVFALEFGAQGRVLALCGAALGMASIATTLLGRAGALRIGWHPEQLRRGIRFSLPLLFYGVAAKAAFTIDRGIVSAQIGVEQLGVLAVASSLALPPMIAAEALNRATTPWVLARLRTGEKHAVVALGYASLLFMVAVCAAYSVALWLAFDLLVGEAFAGALDLALVLCWAALPQTLFFATGKQFGYAEENGPLAAIAITTAGCYWIGLALLLPSGGLDAIPPLVLAYHGLGAAIALFAAQRATPLPWLQLAQLPGAVRQVRAARPADASGPTAAGDPEH